MPNPTTTLLASCCLLAFTAPRSGATAAAANLAIEDPAPISQLDMCCRLMFIDIPETLGCNMLYCYPSGQEGCAYQSQDAWSRITAAECQPAPELVCKMTWGMHTKKHYWCNRDYSNCTAPMRRCKWVEDGQSESFGAYQCVSGQGFSICGL